MSIMKSYLVELFKEVSRASLPKGLTVQQIVELDQFNVLVANCRALRIQEVDILVAVARGKQKAESCLNKEIA